MKILSWNVNGIRAVQKKGFLEWLQKVSPDILCVQETRAHPAQLDTVLVHPPGYHGHWTQPVRRGYSGVATFSKEKPIRVSSGYGVARFDEEGRVLLTEFPDFVLLNIYFPNGKATSERLQYKLDFYEKTLECVRELKAKGKKLIVSGDYNTAHKSIDLAHPEENKNISGFLPVERAWLDRWVEDGQVDIFRRFNPSPHQYTWWDLKTNARERNVGWRIDYHFVTENLVPKVKSADIWADVLGSDHCPVSLELSA